MARTEPPGRHRSSTGSPYGRRRAAFAGSQTASADPDCSGAFTDTGGAPLRVITRKSAHLCGNVRFQPRGILDYRMSLSMLFTPRGGRRHSAAASLRSVRNPCAIQAGSEPPGRRPPAPGSHPRWTHSVTGGPFASSGGVNLAGLRRVTVNRFHPYGTPSYRVGLNVLLTITNVLTSGRCAGYAHNP